MPKKTKVILYGDSSVSYPDGTLGGTNKILYTFDHGDEVLDAENGLTNAIYGNGPYGYDENSTVNGDPHVPDDYPYLDNPNPDTDNELSLSVYPDSYFTMKFMNVDYNVPNNLLLGGYLNDRCNPKYEVVDTAADEIAVSNDIINSSPILLTTINNHSQSIANLFNAPLTPRTTRPVFTKSLLTRMLIFAARRFTTNLIDRNNLIACATAIADSTMNDITDTQFWTKGKLANLFIAETTSALNVKTTNAQQTLASGTAAATASPKTTETFKVIDSDLMSVYGQALAFLENGVGGGRVPVTKNATSGDRGIKNQTTTIPNPEWKNYAYPDSKGKPTLGYGHLIVGGFTTMSIQLSPTNSSIGKPGVSNPITGFWQKPTKTFKTLVTDDQKGVTDEEIAALFEDDMEKFIKQTQNALGVARWNYLHDNDQCLLIVCIDIQYNTGQLKNKFPKLLSGEDGDGLLTRGIGSGMGLQMSQKNLFHLKTNGHYDYDLWTKPSTYTGTQGQYIVKKKEELQKESHRKDVGSQRNDAIYQLFIDKNKFSTYPAKRGPNINYWTKCNVNNIDLTKFQHYNN